jgi:hypothetical protein
MSKVHFIILFALLAMIYACSDETVLEPNQPESCTNTTCRPDYTFYPIIDLDVSHDGNPDLRFYHTGMEICNTAPSDCSGYSWLVVAPIDSIYFAYDIVLEKISAIDLGDTIDSRLEYSPWESLRRDYLPIAEIYKEGEWDPFWSGVFVGSDIRYLGFKMRVSGKDHYGWIGIKVSKYDATIYISEQCYKHAEGSMAVAGQ